MVSSVSARASSLVQLSRWLLAKRDLGEASVQSSLPESLCPVAAPSGTLQEYQKRMKKLDQQYRERIRNAGQCSSSGPQNANP